MMKKERQVQRKMNSAINCVDKNFMNRIGSGLQVRMYFTQLAVFALRIMNFFRHKCNPFKAQWSLDVPPVFKPFKPYRSRDAPTV